MNKKVGVKIISSVLLGTMCFYTMPVFANTKEEVVYSKLKNDGTNYSTVVSERITNTDNSELINDISELLNIENTNGDETFEQNGTNVVWKANGKDIQYQGTIDKDEPITCKVKYELNGKEVEAKDIVGKSGNVKVTLTYTNNDAHTVKVNGKYEKMYTPFIVVAGTIIDNNFKNVNITNGKIIDNGNKKMAIAMCFPGLQESLGISKDKIDIPNTIELTMDAEDFEMNNIISYATPKLVSEADLDMFDNLDDIYAQANKLQDASNQLVEGTDKLNEGALKLNEGAEKLNKGANDALNGSKLIASKVKLSTSSLTSDNSDALKKEQIAAIGNAAATKAVAYVNGQKALVDAKATAGVDEKSTLIKEQAVASAKQIAKQTALATALEVKKQASTEAESQIVATAAQTAETTAENVFMEIKVPELMATGLTKEQATAALANNETLAKIKASAKETATKNAQTKLAEAAKTPVTLTESEIKAKADAKIKASAKETATKNAQTKLAEAAKTPVTLTESEESEIKAKADAGIEAKKATIEATGLASAKQIATQTAESTATTVAQMVGTQVGQTVASEVANQVKTAALTKVASSMTELVGGLDQLTDGLQQLSDGTSQLSNGSKELTAGTEVLAEGMKKFDTEGIKKITNLINGDVKNLDGRLAALKDLANEYKSFAGINEKDEGTVSFITTIDSIKKEDFEKENAQATNGNTTNETVANETISNQDSKNETSNN